MIKLCIIGYNGSVHVQKWIKAIAEREEFELSVITFNKGIQLQGVNYYFLKKFTNTKLDYILNISLVKKFIKKIMPDILHAHYATSYGLLGAFTGFKPYVVTGWGADIFDSPKNPFMSLVLRYALKKANIITVLSKITQQEIKKFTNKPIQLVPFGVDLAKFNKKNNTKKLIHEIRIGTIRTLSEKYGVEYLIRAFANLYPKYPNLYLDIIGDGPQKDFLQTLAKELKVKDRVVFHGFINQNTDFDTYITLLSNFDIFTILSTIDSETFGVAAVEAAALGLPVIGTNVGGLPEVIDNDVTGLIIKPKDVAETTKALENLIANPKLRIKLGENGRKKTERLYDWDKNVDKMQALYQSLLNVKNKKDNR